MTQPTNNTDRQSLRDVAEDIGIEIPTPAYLETASGPPGRAPSQPRVPGNRQARQLRAAADLLDSLPGLPNLYITCSSVDGRVDYQVPKPGMSDAERIAVADRLAAAYGLECGVRFPIGDDGTWTYSTNHGGDDVDDVVDVYVPGLTIEPATHDSTAKDPS